MTSPPLRGKFRRLAIGPVVKKDEVEYFREIGLFETVTLTYAVAAMSPDGARFVAENGIWNAERLGVDRVERNPSAGVR